jgi:UDP-N-acetylmuramoylalanine--D-glutamate ligase
MDTEMKHLRDRHLLVLGLGDSGLAMARWGVRCGAASVRVWDSREVPPQGHALREALPLATLVTGALDSARIDDLLSGIQLVLKSPGLSPTDERVAPLLAAARARAIAVQVELDLFSQALADLASDRDYRPQVLAISGTNGKTTTTAMTALLVERAGRRVATAGNIGPTMLGTLADALDAVDASAAAESVTEAAAEVEAAVDDHPRLPEVWVLELSSFQLDGVRHFEPSAAAVLNLSEDHLDWHGTMAAYAAAKARIAGEHAVWVINRDDARVEAMLPKPAPAAAAKPVRGVKPARAVARRIIRFGLTAPTQPGDFGIVADHGMAWLARVQAPDAELRGTTRRLDAPFDPQDLQIQRLMPADALRVRGRHNAANALAALALASAIDCPLAPMLHALREYRGEPHRVEFVGAVGEVDAYDDSKGTNVGATVAAVDGLGADRSPARLVVILGGDGKGQDFSPLREPLLRHSRAVAIIGRDAAAIEAALAGADAAIPLQRHPTLEGAVAWSFEQARPGDAVLLSPACASLDMFRNYAHRAEVFVAAVRSLAADRGEALA